MGEKEKLQTTLPHNPFHPGSGERREMMMLCKPVTRCVMSLSCRMSSTVARAINEDGKTLDDFLPVIA